MAKKKYKKNERKANYGGGNYPHVGVGFCLANKFGWKIEI